MLYWKQQLEIKNKNETTPTENVMKHLFWMIFSFLFINNVLLSQVPKGFLDSQNKRSIASKPCPLSDPERYNESLYGYATQFPEEWILDCALENAPPLLKG